MYNPTSQKIREYPAQGTSFIGGQTIPFESINTPGTYVCNWSGHLLRVPEDAIAPGRSPKVNMFGTDPLFVTGISDDPFIRVTKARMMASNFDLNVNF